MLTKQIKFPYVVHCRLLLLSEEWWLCLEILSIWQSWGYNWIITVDVYRLQCYTLNICLYFFTQMHIEKRFPTIYTNLFNRLSSIVFISPWPQFFVHSYSKANDVVVSQWDVVKDIQFLFFSYLFKTWQTTHYQSGFGKTLL